MLPIKLPVDMKQTERGIFRVEMFPDRHSPEHASSFAFSCTS